MKPKKIALFGGSFNPIHNQHIKLIESVIEKDLADEAWIIPSKNHPHSKQLTSAEHRVNMIKLAINHPRIKISDVELKSDEINYTIRTIEKLKSQYNHDFYWTMGTDILHDMKNGWHGLEPLLKATEFIIFKRKDYEVKEVPNMKINRILDIDESNISSSEIRQRISQNKSLKNIVPSLVEEYIQKKRLYR